jgi:cytidylate kinase
LKRVIALDGPSGVGKSSVARDLAQRLGWTYLDTGAMYRAITLAWLRQQDEDPAAFSRREWLESLHLNMNGQGIYLNDENVAQAIRDAQVTAEVSRVAADTTVRTFLTQQQRDIGKRGDCVMDGRDIGTVVIPDALLKVFLTASPEVRARRRWLQQGGPDSGTDIATILKEQQERDRKDSERDTAPLKPAADAVILNTDPYDQAQVVDLIENLLKQKQSGN